MVSPFEATAPMPVTIGAVMAWPARPG
jgi:hypothetical protein